MGLVKDYDPGYLCLGRFFQPKGPRVAGLVDLAGDAGAYFMAGSSSPKARAWRAAGLCEAGVAD